MNKLKSIIFPALFSAFLTIGYSQPVNEPPAAESTQTKDTIIQTVPKKEKSRVQNKFYKSPGKAILLSTLLPGGGQYYTENYLKGALMTTAWGTLGYLAIREHLQARAAIRDSNENSYYQHRDQRNLWLWWTAAVWVFSVADAYVSSHMYKFKAQETLSASKFSWGLEIKPELPLTITLKFKKLI